MQRSFEISTVLEGQPYLKYLENGDKASRYPLESEERERVCDGEAAYNTAWATSPSSLSLTAPRRLGSQVPSLHRPDVIESSGFDLSFT